MGKIVGRLASLSDEGGEEVKGLWKLILET